MIRRARLNIQIKLTNFVKLLNCVSLKSSKNAFLVSGNIEFLCLFAIQDEVTGEKISNLRGNYLRQKVSKIWHFSKFYIILRTLGFS